jgi:hypothetical protein
LEYNQSTDQRTLVEALISDGRFLLIFTGLILILTGLFVIVQSITGNLLPHDVSYLGIATNELNKFNNGNITKFMFHDRISFGGSIMAVGLLYLWLAEFPLKKKEPWAWYLFFISGVIGFGSFLTYIGFGYLDTWHGIATLLLLPFFMVGLIRSYKVVKFTATFRNSFSPIEKISIGTRYGLGKFFLISSSIGLFVAGITIMVVGMTTVFVPQDLMYMNITVCGIENINDKLKPLIAHDRSAFGGGLATIGLLYFFILRCAKPSINLWQIVALSMFVGFSSAISVHYFIGYTILSHILPAYLGAGISIAGLLLTFKKMVTSGNEKLA